MHRCGRELSRSGRTEGYVHIGGHGGLDARLDALRSDRPARPVQPTFGLRAPGKGCSIHPVIARSAKTSEMQEHGERFAHLANLLEAEPLIEAPGVVVHLHTQAHRNEIVFAGRGNQRLE
jgi:hypothetical protein